MEYEILENGQVLKVDRKGVTVVKTHHCMSKRVILTQEPAGVRVKIESWDGKPLPFESVTVKISGADVDPVETVCADGLIELTGPAGASLGIMASLAGADPAGMLVTV